MLCNLDTHYLDQNAVSRGFGVFTPGVKRGTVCQFASMVCARRQPTTSRVLYLLLQKVTKRILVFDVKSWPGFGIGISVYTIPSCGLVWSLNVAYLCSALGGADISAILLRLYLWALLEGWYFNTGWVTYPSSFLFLQPIWIASLRTP